MPYEDFDDDTGDRTFEKILAAAVASIIILATVLLCSCNTERRALKKVGAVMGKFNDAGRKVCAEMFPPTVEQITVTDYVKGDTVYEQHIVTVDCDSVNKSKPRYFAETGRMVNSARVQVPCPPSVFRVDTVFRTVTKIVTNTAREESLSKENTELKADADRLKKGRNNWRWIALGSCLLIVVVTGWKVFKLIKGGAITGLLKK